MRHQNPNCASQSNSYARQPASRYTFKVESYDIFLDVDFKNLYFDGRVKIGIETDTDVKLNAVDPEIKKVTANNRPLKYSLATEDLIVATGKFSGTLEAGFGGTICVKLVGLYKAVYDGGYVASSQFEAASARRITMCGSSPLIRLNSG